MYLLDVVPDKPYFVARTKYHEFAIFEDRKPKRSTRWITLIKNIRGDIKVCVAKYLHFSDVKCNSVTGS